MEVEDETLEPCRILHKPNDEHDYGNNLWNVCSIHFKHSRP